MNISIGSSNSLQSFKGYNDEWSLYRRRWAVLSCFMIMNASNTWVMISYGPISYLVSELYNISALQVNVLSMIIMGLNVPGGFFAAWALDYFDRKLMLIIAAVVNAAGGILRVCALYFPDEWQFTILVIGAICTGACQPLITWSPTPIAQGWFGENERNLANSLLSLSNPLGLMCSLVISPMVTNGDVDKVQIVNLIAMAPCVIAAIISFVGGFFASALPPSPPSPAAAISMEKKVTSQDTLRGLKVLFTMPSYWCLMLCVGGGIGIFSSILLMMNQLLCPYGYSSTLAGPVLGPVIVIGGLVGAAIASMIVDKNKKYFAACRTSYVVAGGSLVIFVAAVVNEWHEAVLIILALVFGFFGLPIYPIGNELACELAYPVSPVSCAGFLFMTGGLMGVVMTLIMTLISKTLPVADFPNQTCTANPTGTILDCQAGMWTLVGLLGCLAVISFFIKGDLKRHEAEQAGRIGKNDASTKSINSHYDSPSPSIVGSIMASLENVA